MRSFALALILFAPCAAFAAITSNPAPPLPPAVKGTVADPTGAIVPGAEVDLLDTNGAVAGSNKSDGEGNFQLVAPHPGTFTLVVSEAGFSTVREPVVVAAPAVATAAAVLARPLRIVLPVASLATNVRVNAENSEDLSAPDENRDSAVMSSHDLKALPIFDNDYQTAMSVFMDQNVTDTGGTGLMVDGVEANRATVSASAVQEVRINQDPYSAQYYYPGRGQRSLPSPPPTTTTGNSIFFIATRT